MPRRTWGRRCPWNFEPDRRCHTNCFWPLLLVPRRTWGEIFSPIGSVPDRYKILKHIRYLTTWPLMTSRGQTSGCDTLIVFGPCYWCLGGHGVKFWARSEVSLKSKKCCQKVDLVTFDDLWRPNRWVWHPNSCWYAVLVSWRMLCVNFSSFWGVPNMGWIWAERGLSMGCLDGHPFRPFNMEKKWDRY